MARPVEGPTLDDVDVAWRLEAHRRPLRQPATNRGWHGTEPPGRSESKLKALDVPCPERALRACTPMPAPSDDGCRLVC